MSGVNPERGLCSPIQTQAPSSETPPDSQWLCQSRQKQVSEGVSSKPSGQKGNRDSQGSSISSLFQQTVHRPQTKPKWRPVLDLSALNKFLSVKTFKMETPETIRLSLQQGEWVTSLDFSDACFHIPIHSGSRKYLRFHFQNQSFQFRALPFGLSTAPMEFTCVVKEVKLMAQSRGIRIHQYLDDWLIRAPTKESCHRGTQSLLSLLSGVGLGSEPSKVGTGTQTGFRVCGLQVRPLSRLGQTDTEPLGVSSAEGPVHSSPTFLQSQDPYVTNRPPDSNGKTGTPGTSPHEANPVASQKTLEGSGISRKRDPNSKVSSPALTMVDQRDQCLARPAPTPLASCHSNLYRRLKRRLGCSLRRLHNKRCLVSTRKPPSHKLLRAKSGLAGLKKVPAPGTREGSADCHGQHHSCSIHQQGGRYEVRLTLCPSLAAPVLVQPETGCSQGLTHSGSSQCDCRQVVTSRPNYTDRMVSSSGSVQPFDSNLAPPPSGHVCNKVQLRTSQIRVSSSGPQCLGSGCADSQLGEPGHVHFSPSVVTGQGSQQTVGPSVQEGHIDRSRVAQHAMVLGSGGSVISDPSLSAHPSRPSDTAIQQGVSQGSDQLKPPRAEAIKEQGFTSPVATRIEAPQRSSTRTIYEAKWSVFVRWCQTSQVDFRSPSIKHIADFLLHLFQEKNPQPSTIEGYRSAIADKLGNSSLNVSKNENLTRLLDSFHRDRPKGRRGIPSWNLSLVLYQLTKPPFEPLRKASLKHLTFKRVFLLALGSGKRRSEMHAWLNKNIRHQDDWSNVSLYPSPTFLAKNHLAKEGPECVAPVVIPALAPTLDKSLKEDRSLSVQ